MPFVLGRGSIGPTAPGTLPSAAPGPASRFFGLKKLGLPTLGGWPRRGPEKESEHIPATPVKPAPVSTPVPDAFSFL